MIESGENLSFFDEPLHAALVTRTPPREQLERDALLELIVGAFREIHCSHPTPADLAENAVRAETRRRVSAWLRERRAVIEQGSELRGGNLERRHALSADQKVLQLLAERGVVGAAPHEKRLALLGTEIERVVGRLEEAPPSSCARHVAHLTITDVS